MIEQDTIRLLRECDAGIKMGVSSIDEVQKYVQDEELNGILRDSRKEHERLANEIEVMLDEFHDDGKEPNPMAKGMSWVKTNVKLMMNESDDTIAALITDGCHMGVKSLNMYLNQYEAADDESKKLCNKLIAIEEELCRDLKEYL